MKTSDKKTDTLPLHKLLYTPYTNYLAKAFYKSKNDFRFLGFKARVSYFSYRLMDSKNQGVCVWVVRNTRRR